MRRFVSRTLLIAGVLFAIVWVSAPSSGEGPATGVEPASRPRLVVQLGHQADITSVAFSPDGKQVLTGSYDGTARLWESETGKEIREFGGHGGVVTSVAFSPDGKHVLTGSGNDTAQLWDSATGSEIRRFVGHTSLVSSVAFSPDGRRVLTGSVDETARLWDAATGREIRRFEGHAGQVRSVAFSPDGKQVLTSSGDKFRITDNGIMDDTARLWDAATGKEVRKFEGHTDIVTCVAFSPDGKQVLTGSEDKTARIWDVATGKQVRNFGGHADAVYSVAFSPDGKRVLTGSEDKTARLWDAATGNEIRKFVGHSRAIKSVAFSPDGKRVLTGSEDKTARLWDAATGKEIDNFEGHGRSVRSVAFSPDGKQLLTASWDRAARLWDAATGKEVRDFKGHADSVTSVAFSPDGKQVLTGDDDRTARLWDAATGKEIRTFEGHAGRVTCIAFCPDGKQVLTGSDDRTARLWDAATGKELRTFDAHADAVNSVAFSPDGKQVLTGSGAIFAVDGSTTALWDAATGKQTRTFDAHAFPVQSVAFSPDGKQVLTGSWDNTARLWDAATGREIHTFAGHADPFTSVAVAFSPDGKRVLTGSHDGTARLWDAATGKAIRKFEGLAAEVTSVAYAPDGKRILTGQADGTTILWNTGSGEQLCSLVSFTNGDWAVVDPEGRFDGSNGGDVDGLHWVVGNEPIDLVQLKKQYYDPGLLAKKMGLSREPLRSVADFTNPKLFPVVELKRAENDRSKLDIQLANRGGGIGPVVVKINGKEFSGDARGPAANPNAASLSIPLDLKNDPRLKPGEQNTIEVYAFDADQNWHSRGLRIPYDDPRRRPAEKPNVWAVVIGVSHYQNGVLGKPDLCYPAKDAADFAKGLGVAVNGWVGAERFHLTLLTSPLPPDPHSSAPPRAATPRPNRQNILAALQALQDFKRVKSTDILVLYLAGHGVSRGGADGHFYFPTCDCDADNLDLADEQIRRQYAVSDQEITDAITKIPALKQVMILDTCHAGTLIDDLTKKRDTPSQIRSWEEDKDRTGLHILAGCAADAASYEASRYGQGVLTYSLLFGMRGASLDDDHFVDVSKLFKFSVSEVPKLALGIGGIQEPVIASPKGETFKIGQVSAADESKIPLQPIRPLVLRTNFHDENELDPLNLTDQMDELLRDVSARGQDPPLEFVDARKMPDAYHVAGSYRVAGTDVTVKVRLNPVDKLGVTFDVKGKTTNVAALAEKVAQEIEKRLSPPVVAP